MVKIVIFTKFGGKIVIGTRWLFAKESVVFVRYAELAWSNDQEMEDLAIMSSSQYILGSGSSYSCLAAMVSGCDGTNTVMLLTWMIWVLGEQHSIRAILKSIGRRSLYELVVLRMK